MTELFLSLIPLTLAAVMTLPGIRSGFKLPAQTSLLTGVMAGLFVLFATLVPEVRAAPITFDLPWVPELGLTLSLYLDGLALLFALLITGVGAAVYLYAGYYFDDERTLSRFYALLVGFTGAMLALVLAGNVLTLFIAWELTSVISFLLISFKGDKDPAARTGALRALVITGGGGLALLAGLVLLGTAAGSYQFADILSSGDALRDHPFYTAMVILIMLGCFTKSAQFPFHFWLPGGMSAPSPASAFLHSATMVKAGIYLLARLQPALGDTDLWLNALLWVGLTTMLVGAFLSLHQHDLKGLLAYSTISQLGVLVALIGLPEGHGLEAAYIGLMAHALYKAALFLMTGTIEHSTGTRNLKELGGLRRKMPAAAVITAGAVLSMAGVVPLLGFVGKEVLLYALAPEAPLTVFPLLVAVASSVFTVAVALRYLWEVFFQPAPAHHSASAHGEDHHGDEDDPHHFHAPPVGMHMGPGLLVAASLVLPLLLSTTVTPIISAALAADITLYLLPAEGLANTTLQLSLVVMALGAAMFLTRGVWLRLPPLPLPQGADVYNGVIGVVNAAGDLLLRSQNGKLRYYLVMIFASVALFIIISNLAVNGLFNLQNVAVVFTHPETDALRIILLVQALGATLATILFRKHLLAVLALGVSGYAIAGILVLEPAPDVALVQALVETLGTVLIIIMIARISVEQREKMIQYATSPRKGRVRDAVIATVIGVSVGLFALTAVSNREETYQITRPIASWHLTNAYSDLGVTDAVAGIVTDYRGTDTLLEIMVFTVAGLGVLTLLTLPQSRELLTGLSLDRVRQSVSERRAQVDAAIAEASAEAQYERELEALQNARAESRISTPLTRMVATLVLPFALLIAFSHILYGGGGPGDGFTAGIIGGLAVALWYVVFGYFETRERLNWIYPGRLIAAGLLVAWVNALLPLLWGDAFLQIQTIGDGYGPAGLHLASTLLFEFGIFLTVFGVASVIMEAIAHPRETEEHYI